MTGNIKEALGEPFDVLEFEANCALQGLGIIAETEDVAEAIEEEPPMALGPPAEIEELGECYLRVFDQEVYDSYLARQPAFVPMHGRFDPFEPRHMSRLLDYQSYSGFLNRPVLTFKDACDHSILISQFWADEDEAAKLLEEQPPEPATPAPKLFDERAHNIEMARLDWKSTVAHRNAEMIRLNDLVAEKRLAYQQAKSKKS